MLEHSLNAEHMRNALSFATQSIIYQSWSREINTYSLAILLEWPYPHDLTNTLLCMEL